MSVITDSKDIYVSTQPSHFSGSGTNSFDNFKVCFSSDPLKCNADEYFRISLTQFNAYRNFYLVNNTNNLVYLSYTDGASNTKLCIPVEIPAQDYAGIGGSTGISTAFGNAIITAIHRASGTTGFSVSADDTAPTTTGGTGDRLLNITLTKSSHGLTGAVLSCPHYYGSTTSTNDAGGEQTITDPRNFNDSYALLGGKLESTNIDSKTLGQMPASFTITIATNTIKIQGFYPMQRSTMSHLYFRIQNAGDNQESVNLTNGTTRMGTHMQSSNIVAKIPVNDVNVSAQYEYLSPYFVNFAARNINELNCRLTDQHGRDIEEVANEQDSKGNLFCDFTLKIHKVKRNIKPNYLVTSRDKAPLFSGNDALQNNNRLRINDFTN